MVDNLLNAVLVPGRSLLGPGLLTGSLVLLVLGSFRQLRGEWIRSETEARTLAQRIASLERFVPREALSLLEKDSVDVALGDVCEQAMSVLVVDIRDFSTLSQSMSPEQTFQFINSFLKRMGPVVRRHDGFVEKYLGDGLLALFPGDPRDALDAALDLWTALSEYNGHRSKCGYPTIRLGMAIHRGPMLVGAIGETQRVNSSVVSETLKAASRLETLTQNLGREILVSGDTVDALGALGASPYSLEYVDEEPPQGVRKAIKVYALSPG